MNLSIFLILLYLTPDGLACWYRWKTGVGLYYEQARQRPPGFNRPKNLSFARPDVTAFQYVQRVGYERSIPLPGKGYYANGKSCITGQERWYGWEIREAKKLLNTHFYYTFKYMKGIGIYSYGRYHDYSRQFQKMFGENCASKICSFDLVSVTPICGEIIPSPLYRDETSCIDGSGQLSYKQVEHAGMSYERKIFDLTNPPSLEWQIKQNRKAQKRYGKNCKSGICHYHFKWGGYLCGTNMLRPTPLPIVTLIIVQVLGKVVSSE